jgi:hypothetical protein
VHWDIISISDADLTFYSIAYAGTLDMRDLERLEGLSERGALGYHKYIGCFYSIAKKYPAQADGALGYHKYIGC